MTPAAVKVCQDCDLPLTDPPRETCARPHHARRFHVKQCPSTYVHAPHGACPGLDGTEVDRAANRPA